MSDATPVAPGVYCDKHGEVWQLKSNVSWWVGAEEFNPEGCQPFTRLFAAREIVTPNRLRHAMKCSTQWATYSESWIRSVALVPSKMDDI